MQVGQAKLKWGLQVVSRLKLELALALRMGLHFEIIVVYVVNLGMPLSPMLELRSSGLWLWGSGLYFVRR